MATTDTKLTSRERVLRFFDGKPIDRIPRNDTFWDDTAEKWISEGHITRVQEAYAALGNDISRIGWVDPPVYPNREQQVLEEDEETRVVIDKFGAKGRYWKGRSGTPEHMGWECDSRAVWENQTKPKMLAAGRYQDYDHLKNIYDEERRAGKFIFLTGLESFEGTRRILGDETTLIAMAMDPDWIADFSKTHTDLVIEELDAMWDAGLHGDGVWIYGDMAFNHATMCSPAMYRELIWPDHKRLADWAHAHELKFLYHTDGDVNGVMDLYLEAGFDCLQPLEAKANMDVRSLVPDYGDRLCFMGNIDVMILATNDRDKIEAEVKAKLAAGMAGQCYCYHSDHSVPPQVEWETYLFVIELLDKYGNYE